MKLDELPKFLRPRLRLFLSADLVGSSALKQGSINFSERPSAEGASSASAKWFYPIAEFYRIFEVEFFQEWEKYSADPTKRSDWPAVGEPTVWKINGDEIIFVKDLSDSRECYACLVCWLEAIRKYRAHLKKASVKLDVKATAWLAGFPIMNCEVAFLRTIRKELASFDTGNPILNHYNLLNHLYESVEAEKEFVRDYIGPSIDLGFRIASKSTPRKCMVSLELAYLVAMVDVMSSEFEGKVVLRYEGRHELKGVLGGHAYPMFWIDGAVEDSLSRYEDGISNAEKKLDLNDVKGFCREFFTRHPEYFIEPFIHSKTEKFLTNIPDGYQTKLTDIYQTWKKEGEKVQAEIESEKDANATGTASPEPELLRKFTQALIKSLLG